MNEISVELKKRILTQKLNIWKGTIYDAGLDARVAGVTGNTSLQNASEKRVKEAIQAVELIKELIDELNRKDGADTDDL